MKKALMTGLPKHDDIVRSGGVLLSPVCHDGLSHRRKDERDYKQKAGGQPVVRLGGRVVGDKPEEV